MDRQPDRRSFLASGIFTALTTTAASGDKTMDIASDAIGTGLSRKLQGFLWRSQRNDRRWSSEKYGVLRSGQALTPFVLCALWESDPANIDSVRASNAIKWIREHLRSGCLGVADPDVLEYPVFASAFALRCLVASARQATSPKTIGRDEKSFSADVEAIRNYLIKQQFNESRGFRRVDLAFGGWGFGGSHPDGETGHMDLSHTRWALHALSRYDEEMSAYGSRSQSLLRLLQKHPSETRVQPISDNEVSQGPPFDGGFYFSPIVLAANKGRIERTQDRVYFRSYATATCDGVLALLAAGVDDSDHRVRAAKQWLQTHPRWDYPAGIPRKYPEPWGDAVYFYHQAVRAEAYRRLRIGGDWPARLIERMQPHLRGDGSVVNRRSPLMKEDDPILCTTLALMAVTEAIRAMARSGAGEDTKIEGETVHRDDCTPSPVREES